MDFSMEWGSIPAPNRGFTAEQAHHIRQRIRQATREYDQEARAIRGGDGLLDGTTDTEYIVRCAEPVMVEMIVHQDSGPRSGRVIVELEDSQPSIMEHVRSALQGAGVDQRMEHLRGQGVDVIGDGPYLSYVKDGSTVELYASAGKRVSALQRVFLSRRKRLLHQANVPHDGSDVTWSSESTEGQFKYTSLRNIASALRKSR